jgi:hypothetical protein
MTTDELKSQIESSVKDLNDRLLKENGWDTNRFVFVKYSDEDRSARLETLIDLFLAGMTGDADQIRWEGLYDGVDAILKGEEVQADALTQGGDSKLARWVVARLLTKRIKEHLLGFPPMSEGLLKRELLKLKRDPILPSQDPEAATTA